jgi:hypothetical protein
MVQAITLMIVQAITLMIVQALTIMIVQALTLIRVQALPLIRVRALTLMLDQLLIMDIHSTGSKLNPVPVQFTWLMVRFLAQQAQFHLINLKELFNNLQI